MSRIQTLVCPTESFEEAVRATRLLLDRFADRVAQFECDIPVGQSQGWPPSVRAAGDLLAGLRAPRRGESEAYRQTGVVTRADDATWTAFVEFAPYAYDASAWDADAVKLIGLSDCARSIVVRVDPAELDSLDRELQDAGLPTLVLPRKGPSTPRASARVRARSRRVPMFLRRRRTPPEDPSVAPVEAILKAAASRSRGEAPRREGRLVATHAVWLCACVTMNSAPTWLIYTVGENGIGWQRMPEGATESDVVDAEHFTGDHFPPGNVLAWLRGEWPDPWGGGADVPHDSYIYEEIRRRIRDA